MNSQKRRDSNVNIQLYLHVMNKSNGINEQQINKKSDCCWQISYFFNVKSNQELKKKKEEDNDREEGEETIKREECGKGREGTWRRNIKI